MDFESRVLYVVRNFIEYGNYGKNPLKAVKVIRSHFPGSDLETCRKAFDRYIETYNDVITFVGKNIKHYISHFNNTGKFRTRETTVNERVLISEHPDIPEGILIWMIQFIFFWHHLK
ncbi:MAG: hypothetical protein MUD12_13840 [Spirochaetes bacterium]|nr:hypothetical protein [Spirochaetota bacterium]